MCFASQEMKATKDSVLSIVIIGDSNTEGYGLQFGEAYPERLNQWFDDKATVYNCGVSGSCVIQKELLSQWIGMPYVFENAYKRALELKGDVYVINLGTNDATDGESDLEDDDFIDPYGNLMAHKSQFAENYLGIIEAIYASNPEAEIILCIPIPIRNSIWRKHKQVYLEFLAEEIHRIAQLRQFRCIDLMTELLKIEQVDALYLADGLHLNPRGAECVTKIIWNELQNLITT